MGVEVGDENRFHRLAGQRGWWRPLLELLLAVVWWIVGAGVLLAVVFAAVGVKDPKELDGPSSLTVTLLAIALMIPAAMAARQIFGGRPGTLFSVEGRIRWGWLTRCCVAALVVTMVGIGIDIAIAADGEGGFSLPSARPLLTTLAVIVLLVPPQAAAEEVMFRGVFQQVVGTFVRAAWVPIVISALVFTLVHGVPLPASTAIFAMGLCFAWLTIRTGGIEAGIALHAISNLSAFVLIALTHGTEDLSPSAANGRVGWMSASLQIVQIAVYAIVIDRMWKRRTQR